MEQRKSGHRTDRHAILLIAINDFQVPGTDVYGFEVGNRGAGIGQIAVRQVTWNFLADKYAYALRQRNIKPTAKGPRKTSANLLMYNQQWSSTEQSRNFKTEIVGQHDTTFSRQPAQNSNFNSKSILLKDEQNQQSYHDP